MQFVSHHLEPGELPEVEHVVTEIGMTFMGPLRAAYYLIDSEEFEAGDNGLVRQMLFVILGKWIDFEKELFEYINEIEAARKGGKESEKDALLKNLAEITGVDPEDIEANRKYSAKQLEQIKSFWLYIHKDRNTKSKHAETIRALLALAASEEGGATC